MRSGRYRALGSLVLFCLGAATPLLAQEKLPIEEVRVKEAIADTMTPEELAAYKELLARRLAERRAAKSSRQPLTSADICSAATYETGSLSFTSSNTTVGMVDNYDLPPDVTNPTCTAPATCTGTGSAGSLPRGAVYTGTGTGPDRAYRFRTSADCNLTIRMTPTGGQDLALILYQGACSSSLADCACVSDSGIASQMESIQLSAIAGTDYFVVVDGYSTNATPPGPSGPFNLSITGTGCTLVTPGSDTCSSAAYESGTLPFTSSNTTVGMLDDYDLPPDVTNPTCTAPATCTGRGTPGSLPRGAVYTGTGTGPDRAYRFRTNADCNLTISMTPTGGQDLALILYQGACSSSLADCACVSDTGIANQMETIQLSAIAGTDYFVVVDGYSTGGTPPGPSGPFNVSITGTGCTLVDPGADLIFKHGFQ